MHRNLLAALSAILLLSLGLLALGGPATVDASSCDPEIPCGCCYFNCDQAHQSCLASGQSQAYCDQQRNNCYRICKFCV